MAAPIAINQNDITMKSAMKTAIKNAMKTAIVQNKSAINQKKYLTYRKKWYKVQAKYENCNESTMKAFLGPPQEWKTEKKRKIA